MTAAIGEAGEGTGTGLEKKKESELISILLPIYPFIF